MKYPELIENCKKAIANNRCLGCVGLAEKDWTPPIKCPYLPSAEGSIEQIKLNLGGKRWNINLQFMKKQ